MKTDFANPATEAQRKLGELGGRAAQDLWLSRILGQLLVYLYFQPKEFFRSDERRFQKSTSLNCLVWLPILAL